MGIHIKIGIIFNRGDIILFYNRNKLNDIYEFNAHIIAPRGLSLLPKAIAPSGGEERLITPRRGVKEGRRETNYPPQGG